MITPVNYSETEKEEILNGMFDFPKQKAYRSEPYSHYIYPNYDVFGKEQSDSLAPSTYWQDLLQGFVTDALFAQIDEKPIELLTANEKLGICIGAGIPLKYEDEKISTTYNVGFALIGGKYRLFYNNEPLNKTYC